MKLSWKALVGIAFALVLALLVIFIASNNNKNKAKYIVLSPHYDDASLSLGGLIAKEDDVTVATFFTGTPATSETMDWDKWSGFTSGIDAMKARIEENKNALGKHAKLVDFGYLDGQYRTPDMSDEAIVAGATKDIQALISSFGTTTPIVVLGPADFGKDVTHHDHKLVHDAYLQAMEGFPNSNVSFRFYEDFPYIERYNKEQFISLKGNLEKETGKLLTEVPVKLDTAQLRSKSNQIKSYASQVKAFAHDNNRDIVKESEVYTNSRCSTQTLSQPCEMTYEVFLVK